MKNKWITLLLIASIFISSCGGTPTESANKYETIPPAIPGEVVYIPFKVTINWNAPLVWVSTYLDQVK